MLTLKEVAPYLLVIIILAVVAGALYWREDFVIAVFEAPAGKKLVVKDDVFLRTVLPGLYAEKALTIDLRSMERDSELMLRVNQHMEDAVFYIALRLKKQAITPGIQPNPLPLKYVVKNEPHHFSFSTARPALPSNATEVELEAIRDAYSGDIYLNLDLNQELSIHQLTLVLNDSTAVTADFSGKEMADSFDISEAPAAEITSYLSILYGVYERAGGRAGSATEADAVEST